MTRTLRAYNRHLLHPKYHPYKQFNMKCICSYCCNQRSRMGNKRRQSWKRELREITSEYAKYGLFTGDFPYDFCDVECCFYLVEDPLDHLLNSYYDYIDSTDIYHILDDILYD